MSTLKFGEQEAGEELMSAALYVEEGQGEDEGAPQDGMAYLRLLDYVGLYTLSRLCNSYESQSGEGREKAMPRHSDRRYRANTDHKEVDQREWVKG